MNKMSQPKKKLIKAEFAGAFEALPLTLEQRLHSEAIKAAGHIKLNKVLEIELAQLFNDGQFSIEVSQCSHSVIQSWFNELPRVFVKCQSLVPKDEDVFLALDYKSAHRMSDLCLGGALKKTNQDISESEQKTNEQQAESVQADESPYELSMTETRICGRLLQKQVQGIQQLLFKERSSLMGEICKDEPMPNILDYLTFKVRLILDAEIISWFIWLPVSFFQKSKVPSRVEKTHSYNTLPMTQSHRFVVKGNVEMAMKKVTLKQLKACLKGAILPIELHEPALFKLGKTTFFKGQIAEQDTNLTFQITEIPNKE